MRDTLGKTVYANGTGETVW